MYSYFADLNFTGDDPDSESEINFSAYLDRGRDADDLLGDEFDSNLELNVPIEEDAILEDVQRDDELEEEIEEKAEESEENLGLDQNERIADTVGRITM